MKRANLPTPVGKQFVGPHGTALDLIDVLSGLFFAENFTLFLYVNSFKLMIAFPALVIPNSPSELGRGV
jgi:hypothetical protein